MILIESHIEEEASATAKDPHDSVRSTVEWDLSQLDEDGRLNFDAALLQRPVIELPFAKAGDGRALSHAALLRRTGYSGDIRAVGDVTVDYLLLMKRCGFSSAVLRADQSAAVGYRLLAHYEGFYQASSGMLDPQPPRVLEPV